MTKITYNIRTLPSSAKDTFVVKVPKDEPSNIILEIEAIEKMVLREEREQVNIVVDSHSLEQLLDHQYADIRTYLDMFFAARLTQSDTTADNVLPLLNFNYQKYQLDDAIQPGFYSYVGPIKPQALLLGDEHNVNWKPKEGYEYEPARSAFVPWGGSARYLFRAINRKDMITLGLANANEEENLDGLWRELGKPPVVALGRNAQSTLNDLGIPHSVVPHPQYARRFHYMFGQEYGQLILSAIDTPGNYMDWRKDQKQKRRAKRSQTATSKAI